MNEIMNVEIMNVESMVPEGMGIVGSLVCEMEGPDFVLF